MNRRAFVHAAVVLLIVAGLANAGEGKLAGEPKVSQGPGGFEIAFALTAPNDVTVRVANVQGEVVRHLASGMVGVKPAAKPFQPDSLAQKIAWDGKDDAGKPAPAGCKVVIGVGARGEFDKFVLSNPDGFASLGNANWSAPGAIAVGPKGHLYVVEQ